VSGLGIDVAFSPEERLLLCCARVHLSSADRQELEAVLEAGLDWPAVLAETRRQCIVPMVHRHLRSAPAGMVPVAVLNQLHADNLLAAASSMALAAELCVVTRLLEAENIPALPYKGPALAIQAYGDIALRTFTDLDVLVPREDVSRAREALRKHGYEPREPLSPLQEQATLRLEHNLQLENKDRTVLLELHWSIAPAAFTFSLPIEQLWQRSGPLKLGGTTIRAMAIDDLMLVLPVHAARHGFSAVEWIAGIAELMRKPGAINWAQVIQDAERFRVGRIVRLAVALANRLLGAPVLDRAAQWVEGDRRVDGLVKQVAVRLFKPRDNLAAGSQWSAFRFELTVKDSYRIRVRDGWTRLTQPSAKDWEAARVPDALFPVYQLFRPLRLGLRYLRHLGARER
jgi:hypothetical protein